MYTGTDYTGKMFAFGHCEVYNLSNWNGAGSWVNNQSVATPTAPTPTCTARAAS